MNPTTSSCSMQPCSTRPIPWPDSGPAVGWWSTPRIALSNWESTRTFRVATVDASQIALRHGLGSAAQPVVNTSILGAFVRATGIVTLDDLLVAIEHEVPNKAEENQAAATEAHDQVMLGVAV